MAKGLKTGGGSRRGRPNKSTADVQEFVDSIFRRVNPQVLAEKLLNSDNEKVSAVILLKLLEYRYGKPIQPIEQTVITPMSLGSDFGESASENLGRVC